MRADQLLVHRGLAASRSQAQRLIASGVRALGAQGWRSVSKADELPESAEIELLDAAEVRYVSRGGLKLEAALRDCRLKVDGLRCLDAGQSTGGFTDCLLQHGAAWVLGVDVGHRQVHPKLRTDPRVGVIEGVNMRLKDAIDVIASQAQSTRTDNQYQAKNGDSRPLEFGFDLVVGDLSFISQTLVAPQIVELLKPAGQVLMLVKPQFELQPDVIGKGGIVRDAALYEDVEAKVCSAWRALGLHIKHYLPSAITGGDGNREFFVHAAKA